MLAEWVRSGELREPSAYLRDALGFARGATHLAMSSCRPHLGGAAGKGYLRPIGA